ncbi:alpha/beta fold hydrolase [Bradyrhizobium brasilense]|uniref:alpha/beta fold hydrolase n=1 Tax=Bradyrhizobium brasilense TaxID=1419277 RepID=UPI001E3762C4|nr:alpha/beta hydrolase [Bradyrhizobium brasilense]MCC8973199.1 alpha/beta hydrolase [Bradyrhizobium brasilense]
MIIERTIEYLWEGRALSIGMARAGNGPDVILLPALSSISTRAEMYPLLERLGSDCRATTVDWLGFGDLPRPRADWSPEMLSTFLDWFLSQMSPTARMIVAAGHAATYALHHAARHRDAVDRLVLLAPTWRGPLPTMMGYRPWFARVRAAIDWPLIGQLLYRINVSRFVVTSMAREHVYSEADWLSGDRLAAKLAVTQAKGARHASVRFVTGYLDRVASREDFLDLMRKTDKPTLVVYGHDTPARSRGEIEALAALPNVRLERLEKGKLSLHEEFPDAVMSVVRPFLFDGAGPFRPFASLP